jgi:dienelactone hydrolase
MNHTTDAIPERAVQIPAQEAVLHGDLVLPPQALGLVLFAHGSGSGRHSPRNRYVAGVLQEAGIGTLLLDLLTEREESVDQYTRHLRFDIGLLARRLVAATDWVVQQPDLAALPLGYFGASTGAAAAIMAAVERPTLIRAVVSRGGRPDLGGEAVAHLQAPTLLLVGGRDSQVIDLNQEAYDHMFGEKRLEIIPEATHLFEEPGTLERVAELAAEWFARHLR